MDAMYAVLLQNKEIRTQTFVSSATDHLMY